MSSKAASASRGRKRPAAGATPQADVEEAGVVAPAGVLSEGYASGIVSLNLTRRQAAAAKMLHESLRKCGESYQCDGYDKPVCSHHTAIRWMLDRYADAVEEAGGRQLAKDYGLTFR